MSSLRLLASITIASAVAACSGSSTPVGNGGPAPAATSTSPTEPGDTMPGDTSNVGKTPGIRAGVDAEILATLKEGGLDIANLPATLDEVLKSSKKRSAVMETFKLALGVECTGCHVAKGKSVDYEADSPQKNVAKKMWTNFVKALKQKDGSALYCDSCHQGKKEFLDRSDKGALEGWMKANMVGKLDRRDGQAHACATCHGEPFNESFLDSWKK